MREIVVDASALGAVLFQEPSHEQVARALQDACLISTPLIQFELANVCWKKIRKYPLLEPKLRAAFNVIRRTRLVFVAVDFEEVLDLALKHQLTAYDASYLWIAQKTGYALASLDQLMLRVAREQGISVCEIEAE